MKYHYQEGDLKISYFIPQRSVKICKFCVGNGKLFVYRSDFEDFDEILCPECQNSKKYSE